MQHIYRFLEGKVEGVRKRGRPRDTWIQDLLNWTGMKTYGELKRIAEERDKWRLMVVNLRNEDDR